MNTLYFFISMIIGGVVGFMTAALMNIASNDKSQEDENEQEPILDKIRAEIDNVLSDGMIHKKTVLGIIDKYKAESEK